MEQSSIRVDLRLSSSASHFQLYHLLLQPPFTHKMFASALVSLALFTVAAQAGKRGLAWPWCEFSSILNLPR